MNTETGIRLPEEQQRKARRHLHGFFWLNGIAVACVMENILLLWALQNGVSAPRTAVLSSFAFLAMPFMFFGKRLSARLGLVRAKSLCWSARYLFILFMLPVPWMRSAVGPSGVFGIIAACTFIFFVFRSMGMINTVPLIGIAAGRRDIGSFHAGVGMRSNISYFLTLILVMQLLRGRDTPGIYQVVLAAGCLAGLFSVTVLRGIPEPPDLRLSARVRIGDMAREVFGSTVYSRLVLAWSVSIMATALMVPIAMLALKRGYGVPDNTALGFTLIELAGAIGAAAAMTVITDHTGPRPIILLSMVLFLFVAGFWAFAPVRFNPLLVGGVFLVGGLGKGGIHLGLTHYLLATTTARNRFGIGMFMQMMSGAVSGLAGALIGGGLLRLLAPHVGEGLALYHAYYRIILLLAVGMLFAVTTLPRLKDWRVHDVIGLIFSFNDLRALITLNRLRRPATDDEDAVNLDRLSALNSRYSEPVLREFLLAGRLIPRARAIQALSRIPFGENTAQALIREVREGAFTNGWRAAELLGQRRIAEAVPALREGLHSADPFLCGKCMVALARLNDSASYPALLQLFLSSDNPRIVIHGAQALELIRSLEHLRPLMKKTIERDWPQPVLDELLLAAAALCGKKRQVYRRLRAVVDPEDIPEAPPDGVFPPPPDAPSHVPMLYAFLSPYRWDALPGSMRLALVEMLTP